MKDYVKELIAFLIIVISSIIFIVCVANMFKNYKSSPEYLQDLEAQQMREEMQSQCDHEFVITSELDYLFKSYRTISRCIKCGLEVR